MDVIKVLTETHFVVEPDGWTAVYHNDHLLYRVGRGDGIIAKVERDPGVMTHFDEETNELVHVPRQFTPDRHEVHDDGSVSAYRDDRLLYTIDPPSYETAANHGTNLWLAMGMRWYWNGFRLVLVEDREW